MGSTAPCNTGGHLGTRTRLPRKGEKPSPCPTWACPRCHVPADPVQGRLPSLPRPAPGLCPAPPLAARQLPSTAPRRHMPRRAPERSLHGPAAVLTQLRPSHRERPAAGATGPGGGGKGSPRGAPPRSLAPGPPVLAGTSQSGVRADRLALRLKSPAVPGRKSSDLLLRGVQYTSVTDEEAELGAGLSLILA